MKKHITFSSALLGALAALFLTGTGSVTAQARLQCERAPLSGIGFARTRSRAEDNASQAWRDNAKNTFGESYKLKDAKITSDIRCNRNKRRVRRIVNDRTTDPVTIGRSSRAWICDVTAKPCLDVADKPDVLAEPDGKIWKRAQKRLSRRGFEYVQVHKVKACKNRKLFELEVVEGRNMFRNKKRLGDCPYGGAVVDEIIDEYKRLGYSYIKMKRDGRGFSGTACRGADQFKLKANRWGDSTRERNIGECPHGGLTVRQVRRLLRRDGYSEITFRDDTPPNYKVRACRDGDSYVMRIDRNGKIHGSYSDKRCGRGGYSLKRIRSNLQNTGYSDIKFTDKDLPRYVAEVCRDNRRLSLKMNRWGEVRRKERIGRCHDGRRGGNKGPGWAKSAQVLSASGYERIKYKGTNKQTREHSFTACKGPKKYSLKMRRGEVVHRKRRKGLAFLECIVQ